MPNLAQKGCCVMALKVGLQLYSVRESLQKDPNGTLEYVANTGYKYLEAANHNATEDPGVGFGLSAQEMKRRLDDLGLTIVGCHVHPWESDSLEPVLDYHQELGNARIGCSMAFFPYGDVDHVRRLADAFNEVGELCKSRGLQFYYHNHFQEFQFFGGKSVFDLLMENTDPELVFLEIDTYWTFRGGQDPRSLMDTYQDRVILLHQKDFPENAVQPLVMYDGLVDIEQNITMETFMTTVDPQCFAEIGTGILPIQDIVDQGAQMPALDYIILEQDHSALGELEGIKVSMDAFRRFSGIQLD